MAVVHSARGGDVRAEKANVSNVDAVFVELRRELDLPVSEEEKKQNDKRETAEGGGFAVSY